MCLIFISFQEHPSYKLIVAANRDEFHRRKTAAADFWKDYPNVLGGRDLEANGTWFGVSRSGKISLLTNYRDPQHINPIAPSRGHLVSDFLEDNVAAEPYMKAVESRGKHYNGYNLVAGTADELWYHSNYASGIQSIAPGLHGLSNHLLDTAWPKVKRGKQLLETILKQKRIEPSEIFDLLYDDHVAPDNQLPDTGVGLERERALSSMFIKSPDYGSRCSTVVLIDRQNHLLFSERVYDLSTFQFATKDFEFDIH